MSTIAVVDVITQYLITFGPLLGDIKKRILFLYFISTVNQRNDVIFMSYEGLFVMTNYAIIRKKIVMA